jgi:hypothetical protein
MFTPKVIRKSEYAISELEEEIRMGLSAFLE